MRHSLSLTFALAASMLLGACSRDNQVFPNTPTERSLARQDSLREVLVSAPQGWEVLYFPKTDSLLFTNPKEEINQHKFPNQLGYGGFYYQMTFHRDGTLELQGDYTDGSAKAVQMSTYELGQAAYTRLSFTTGSYLTELIGERYEGELDFLFRGTDADGQLIFESPRTTKPACSYFILRRIAKDADRSARLERAEGHRIAFEQMRNPQIRIHQGGRTLFLSNYIMKYSTRNELTSYGRNLVAQRYALFTAVSRKALIPDGPPQAIVGLGSGYVGTPEGLTFLTGIRYSAKYIFSDFERKGDRFFAELVEVYDAPYRTRRLVSRHLHPEGVETGIIAELYDDPDATHDYY